MNASELPTTYRKANQLTSKPGSVIDPGQIQTVPVYGLDGVRCRGSMSLIQAFLRNVGTCLFNVVRIGGAEQLVVVMKPMKVGGAKGLSYLVGMSCQPEKGGATS